MQIDANPYESKTSSEHLRSPRNKKWKDGLTENMYYRDTGYTYTFFFFNIIFFFSSFLSIEQQF